jgi:hypothetical protein
MVGLLVKSAQAFGVDHEDMLVILGMYGLIPDPKPFGARVDSGAHAEALALIENDSVKQVAFSSSIQASDGDDAKRSRKAVKELFSLWREFVN